MKKTSLSIVIPTLGGEVLYKTLKQLMLSSNLPNEILICVPSAYISRIKLPNWNVVRVIETMQVGQVAQRAEGFLAANGEMVLQLDDDINVHPNAINLMVECLRNSGRKNAIGPVYYDGNTSIPIHRLKRGLLGILHNLFSVFVEASSWGAARMGKMTNEGINYGVDPSALKNVSVFKTDWLPGGCVLCYRSDLIFDAFFPYSGKAYCEDLIHSHIRNTMGIQHSVSLKAIVSIEPGSSNSAELISEDSMRAKRYYAKLAGGNIYRLKLIQLINKCIFFAKQL